MKGRAREATRARFLHWPPVLLPLLLSACGPGRASPATAELEQLRGAAALLPERVEGATGERAPRGAEWCASGGAPVVGAPVVDAQDRLYFATVDGSLHAFESDGRYRFSYTVQGTPRGSVSLRPPDGTLLLATTPRRVYALSQAGVLRWSFSAPSPIWSGIVPLEPSTVVVLGLDRRLYALTTTGGARYSVAIPSEPSGEPQVSPRGVVWIPLQDGVARIEGARLSGHVKLGAFANSLVLHGEGAVVRADRDVWLFDAQGKAGERLSADEIGGGPGGIVFVSDSGELEWRRAGVASRYSLELGARLSAQPAVARDWVAVPLASGELVLLHSTGEVHVLRLTESPLGRPVWGQQQLYLPAADGRICVVRIPEPGAAAVGERKSAER